MGRGYRPITQAGAQYRADLKVAKEQRALVRRFIKTENDLQRLLAQVGPHQREAVERLWREQTGLVDPSQSPADPSSG